MTKKDTGKDVALSTEVGLPAELMGSMEEDAGRGISDNPNDVGIPFIAVLQDMSPQVKTRDEKYIEGAQVGMLFNTETRELYPHGVAFLPVHYESCQVEWVPRDSGGGFVAKHPYDTPLLQAAAPNPAGKGPPRLASGNDLVETRYWYGFFRPLLEAGGIDESRPFEPAVLAFSSTGLKVSRGWVGQTKRNVLPGSDKIAPIFSRIYLVTTGIVKKNNNEWFLPVVEMGRWVTAEEYGVARRYAEQAEAGAIRVAQPEQTEEAAEDVV